MTWTRLMRLLEAWLNHRRHPWVEISVARAWSHDLPPRLFDVGER